MPRETVERFIYTIFPTERNRKRAEAADRKADNKVGARLKRKPTRDTHTDWRTMLRKTKEK